MCIPSGSKPQPGGPHGDAHRRVHAEERRTSSVGAVTTGLGERHPKSGTAGPLAAGNDALTINSLGQHASLRAHRKTIYPGYCLGSLTGPASLPGSGLPWRPSRLPASSGRGGDPFGPAANTNFARGDCRVTGESVADGKQVSSLARPHGEHVVTLIAADVGDSVYDVEPRSRNRRSPSSIQFRTVRPETPRRRPAESNVQPSSQISRIAVDSFIGKVSRTSLTRTPVMTRSLNGSGIESGSSLVSVRLSSRFFA